MSSQHLLCLVVSSRVFIGVYLGPSVQPIPPVFSHPPTLWSVLEPSAICPFVSITARLIAGNEPLDGGREVNFKFILSENVLFKS